MIRRRSARRVRCTRGAAATVVACLLLAVALARAQIVAAPERSSGTSRPTTVPATVPTTTSITSTITSGTPPIGAPRGAVVLFDGDNTDGWTTQDGKPCTWKVLEDDSMVAGGGNIVSKETFEDVQLHVEFWLPKHPPQVTGQARGNSGVYFMGRYEIQVLDSFQQTPDKHGCGAIYGKKKPKENACTPPETWQSYDIKFTAPRFAEDGKKVRNARVHVIHNGVTIHDDVEVDGPTRASMADDEKPGPAPIMLQDHGNPVRFRNIYALPLKANAAGDQDAGREKTSPSTRPAAVRPTL